MAEIVLGVVPIAAQILNSVVKIKSVIEDIKDTPNDIKYSLKQLEILGKILSTTKIAKESTSPEFAAASTECFHLVTAVAESLGDLAEELQAALEKGWRVGSVKTVMKKGDLKKLSGRLTGALSLFMLGEQLYTKYLQEQNFTNHRTLEQQLELNFAQINGKLLQVMDSQAPFAKDLETKPKRSARSYRAPSEVAKYSKATLQAPYWLRFTSRAVTFSYYNSGWGNINFGVRSYFTVPVFGTLHNLIDEEDVAGIRKMFSEGKATPHDRIVSEGCEYGSLLQRAAGDRRLEVCRLLIENGADCHDFEHGLERSLTTSQTSFSPPQSPFPNQHLDLIRLFVHNNANIDDLFTHYNSPEMWHTPLACQLDTFMWLINRSSISFEQSSLKDCVGIAIRLGGVLQQTEFPALLRRVFVGREIDNRVLTIRSLKGKNLMHSTCGILGYQCATNELAYGNGIENIYFPHNTTGIEDLLQLIRNLAAGNHGLHDLYRTFHRDYSSDVTITPLLNIFKTYFLCMGDLKWYSYEQAGTNTPGIPENKSSVPVLIWLEQLHAVGVNLVEFGKVEKELHIKLEMLLRDFYYAKRAYYDDQSKYIRYRLLNFTYGPTPSDWKFYFIEILDNSFRDFWRMLDHPEWAIPGAWVPFDEQHSSRYYIEHGDWEDW